MDFGGAIKSGFQNYFNFKDRASRSEFWWWTLFVFLSGIAANILDGILTGGDRQALAGLLNLVLLIPSISITTRRLHDVDRSGWWQLIALTIFGLIPLLYWECKKGSDGGNRFGSDPLARIGNRSRYPED